MHAVGEFWHKDDQECGTASARSYLARTVVMVGLMGAGKSTIGQRLAVDLKVPFLDVDSEIESVNNCTISTFFAQYGETAFRDAERRIMTCLLTGPMYVLAAGGGTFMDPATRAAIKTQAVSVWLKVELDVLLNRTTACTHRPLLQGKDPRAVLIQLMEERYPIYATADITVESSYGSHEIILERVVRTLAHYQYVVLPD